MTFSDNFAFGFGNLEPRQNAIERVKLKSSLGYVSDKEIAEVTYDERKAL